MLLKTRQAAVTFDNSSFIYNVESDKFRVIQFYLWDSFVCIQTRQQQKEAKRTDELLLFDVTLK